MSIFVCVFFVLSSSPASSFSLNSISVSAIWEHTAKGLPLTMAALTPENSLPFSSSCPGGLPFSPFGLVLLSGWARLTVGDMMGQSHGRRCDSGNGLLVHHWSGTHPEHINVARMLKLIVN